MRYGRAIEMASLLFIVLSWFLTCYFMGEILSRPSDETGHAVGMFLLPIFWTILSGIILILLALSAFDNKKNWVSYILSLSFLPTAWVALYFGFLYFERERISNTNDSWDATFTMHPSMVQIFVVCLAISAVGGLLFWNVRKKTKVIK